MTRLLVLLLASLLAACANHDPNRYIAPVNPSQLLQIPSGKGAVIIGHSVKNPTERSLQLAPDSTGIGWIAIDPVTGRRVGVDAAVAQLTCNMLGNCDADTGRAVQYQVYVLDPGTYALGWVANGGTVAEPSIFSSLTTAPGFSVSLDARAQATTPVFKLAPGEVVYPGDLIFDFASNDRLSWTIVQNDAAARRYLSATGLAGQLIDRPIRRADGAPVRATDGAVIVGHLPGTITFGSMSGGGAYR